MKQAFEYVHVRSGFVPDAPHFMETIRGYGKALESIGGLQVDPETPVSETPRVYVMDTGGTERQLLDLLRHQADTPPTSPTLLIAHPAYNSLPASLEVLARLQQEYRPGQILFLNSPEDREGLQKVIAALAGLHRERPLEGLRIGLIGAPSDWLVASSPAPDLVEQTWGPHIIPVDIADLQGRMAQVSPDQAREAARELKDQAREVREPNETQILDVVKVYLALRALVDAHDLDALTLRCFDLVLDQQTTGCYALSELIDAGIVAGCEGDLVSTLGMLWAQKETREVPWMANPAHLDPASDRLTLAHCTVPRNMVLSYGLRSHFESGLGVGLQGEFSTGPVTLIRLGGKALDRIWIAEGRIGSAGSSEQLCRTQVDIQLAPGAVGALLENPLGNHLVMIRGHHEEVLRSKWKRIPFPG